MNNIESLKESMPIEIEFEDENNIHLYLKSKIKTLTPYSMLIELPCHKDKLYSIPVGMPIKLIANLNPESLESTASVWNSSVIEVELFDDTGLWISIPIQKMDNERRQFLRAQLPNISVEVTVFKNRLYDKERSFFAFIKDIGSNGLSYYSEDVLLDYFDIECKISLTENDTPIVVKCESIYSLEIFKNNKKQYLNAFKFTDISKTDKEKINVKCTAYYRLD